MGLATRQLLNRAGAQVKRVAVPEWESEMLLRALSAAQLIDFIEYSNAQGNDVGANLRTAAWLIVAGWVDEAGDPVLGFEDIQLLLATQPADLINRLGQAVSAVSGLIPEAVASAEKNSESNQS
jgi:hypothetical protein